MDWNFTDEDIKNALTIGAFFAAWWQSHRAKKQAGRAEAKAEEAIASCSYPACGHECGSEEAQARATAHLESQQARLPI